MMRLATVLLCLLLQACSGMFDSLNDSWSRLTESFTEEDNAEPPTELTDIDFEIEPGILWSKRIGAGAGSQLVNLVATLSRDKIVVADRNGLVVAMNTQTGDEYWETETDLPVSAGPGIGDGNVVLGTSDAEVVALKLEDGSNLWTSYVSSEILSVPQIRRGVVVIRTIDGKVTGLSEDSGKLLWTFERPVPSLSLRGASSPVIIDDLVICGFANGKVAALRLKDGKLEWEASLAFPRGRSELERMVDIDADPIVSEDVIYLANYQAGISAVALQSGDIIWQREGLSSFAGLAADWRYLYVTNEDSSVWQLDKRNGASLWKQEALLHRHLSGPVIYKSAVVVGDFEGYLHWLARSDGHQIARIRVEDEAISVAPIVNSDDILFAYTTGGVVAAISVEAR